MPYVVSDEFWDVQNVKYLRCRTFRMWNVWDVGCSGCEMFELWDVRDVGCAGCGMFRMWDVWDVGCSGCGMFEMWDVRCGMFAGMRDVDLQNALLTVGVEKRTCYLKLVIYFPLYSYGENKIESQLDFSIYATKSDLKMQQVLINYNSLKKMI